MKPYLLGNTVATVITTITFFVISLVSFVILNVILSTILLGLLRSVFGFILGDLPEFLSDASSPILVPVIATFFGVLAGKLASDYVCNRFNISYSPKTVSIILGIVLIVATILDCLNSDFSFAVVFRTLVTLGCLYGFYYIAPNTHRS